MPAKVSPYLGIEIRDINLAKPLDARSQELLIEQCNQYHLLVIRKQKLTEDHLIKTSQIFGEPVPALVPTYRLENYPVITRHTNKKNENRLPTGVIAPEYVYHSDSYFAPNPSKATLLYSLKSPTRGGETYFVNTCFAYETLDESIKGLIEGKRAIYKNVYINQPPVVHPLVRVHPVTKIKSLFVNIHRALGIEGFEHDEALGLLEYLYKHSTKNELIYKHKWCDGDLLIWNNPTTMHCATSIDDSEERLLYRILTKGDLPVQ